MNTLSSLECLKTLELDPVVLFGWRPEESQWLEELLPNSFSRLHLRSDFGAWRQNGWKAQSLHEKLYNYVKEGNILGLEKVTWQL